MAARRTEWRAWHPDEIRQLETLLADDRSYAYCGERLGRSRDSVRIKAAELGLGPLQRSARGLAPLTLAGHPESEATRPIVDTLPSRHEPAVSVLAPEDTADESDDAFLSRVLQRTGRAVAKSQQERFARVRIATDEPIALSLSSDWHLTGGGATDVAGLLSYADAVRATPGAYAAVVGDVTDNAIKHRGGAGPVSVPDELRLADLLFGRFGRRMLWATSGNHDDWTVAFAGVDNLRALAKAHRVHYAPDELIVVLEIVDPTDPETVTARYCIVTRHKFRRHSNLNYTHACWRLLEDFQHEWPTDPDGRALLPDVVAIGDNHVAAVETRSTPRGDVVAARMGAWQVGSSFGRAFGFAKSRPTAPTVILHPTRTRPPVAYADYREAFDALTRLRGSVPVQTSAA